MIVGVPFKKDVESLLIENKKISDEIISIVKEEFFSKEKLKTNLVNHFRLLAWLIKEEKIAIKFAFANKDSKVDETSLKYGRGLVHEKIGIFRDENDYVSFSGSANLTIGGWLYNREEIKTFRSWDNTYEYAKYDSDKFNIYWENKDEFIRLVDFPRIAYLDIFQDFIPKKIKEINLDEIDMSFEKEKEESIMNNLYENSEWIFEKGFLKPKIEFIEPWVNQIEALDYLKNLNYKGFLAMATGTGKTKTAILAGYELYKLSKQDNLKLILIILVPDKYLVDQWFLELKDLSYNIVKCYSDNQNWVNQINTHIDSMLLLNQEHLFIIGTQKSLKADFIESQILNRKGLKEKVKTLFICDEAHSLGTPTGLRLIDTIETEYAFGLSATPYRYFDEKGTKKLLDWFLPNESEVFELTLKDAQQQGVICKFNYYLFSCYFDDQDIEYFESLSEAVAKIYDRDEKDDRLVLLFNQRADIIKKCKNKKKVLERILNELITAEKLEKCVIYNKDNEQITRDVITIIMDLNSTIKRKIRYNLINGEMDYKTRRKFIDYLGDNTSNILLAMKCLDQGVDIPFLERAIFMASSGSSLEHIQRAGRILRKNEYKQEPVEIYDIIVLPTKFQMDNHPKLSKKILEIEEKRISFFAEYADNKNEVEDLLFDIRRIKLDL